MGSAVESWRVAAEAMTEYWTQALREGKTPIELAGDGARWMQAVLDRRPPTWTTANEVIFETPVMRLRRFEPAGPEAAVPTLVLPPQAGHDSCIVDYSDSQSQIQTIQAAGLDPVYSLDWIGATQETKHATLTDYLSAIDRAVEHMGAPINLIGDCQGGWLAFIYAALNPEKMHTVTIAGAPIDFHVGEPVIGAWVRACAPGGDLAMYREIVRQSGGVFPGAMMLSGFITIRPESEMAKLTGLLPHLDDPEHMQRYRDFEDWYKHVQDLPGDFYLWIVEHLFRDNELIKGELVVDGQLVDLQNISCPLYLLAGETDHITPPGQVFAAADAVGTPADQIVERTSSGGHLGLFMGSEALREHWPPLLADIAERSREGSDAGDEASARAATPPGPTIPKP